MSAWTAVVILAVIATTWTYYGLCRNAARRDRNGDHR